MIQAIVFLPLLGAVLAGLIALAGAHARNPGGDEMEHGDHHDGHAAASAVSHDAAAGGHHDDHAVEAPAAGSRTAEVITTTLLLVSAALSWMTFVDVGFLHHDARVMLMPWIGSGDL